MSKETLKNLIELVPENDIDVLYRVIVKYIGRETRTGWNRGTFRRYI